MNKDDDRFHSTYNVWEIPDKSGPEQVQAIVNEAVKKFAEKFGAPPKNVYIGGKLWLGPIPENKTT